MITLTAIAMVLLNTALAAPGTVLPVVPQVAPGRIADLPADPLAEARQRARASDFTGARAILEPYLASKKSWQERTATRLLLGQVYMELGLYNLASGQFYRVRRGDGGDAKVAAWYEAQLDLLRGRPHAAIKECTAYMEQYPQGHRASECLVVIGDAEAARGRLKDAEKAYESYLEKPGNKKQMREEEMSLRIALATAKWKPERSIPLLQELALRHRFASTGTGAINGLHQLREQGHEDAVLPTDPQSRMDLANSVRRAGWADQAWAMFEELAADEDPEIKKWVDESRDRFARSTRHPIPRTLATVAEYQSENGATGQRAWTIFEGWRKAGRWKKAAKWGRIGLEKHADKWPWRGRKDDVAQAIMLAGQWEEATAAWDAALKARHGSGQDARFYRSLTAYLAGNFERADAGFTTLAQGRNKWTSSARYWRIKTREASGRADTMEDRTVLESQDPTGWYRLLLNQNSPNGDGWLVRDGTWGGQATPTLAEIEEIDAYPGVQVGLWPTEMPVLRTSSGSRRGLEIPASTVDASKLKWPLQNDARAYISPRTQPMANISNNIPDGYVPSMHHQPETALKTLKKIGDEYKDIWPDLLDAYHLAEAGMYGESGPIVRAAYAEFRAPHKVWSASRREKIRAVKITKEEWAEAARAARDHHFAVKHVWGTKSELESSALERLQFPVAYAQELWPHCQKWDIDPFLVLAIMRQESIYNPDALSHTGAIGLMQFIKGTGAKVSALLDEPFFSPHGLYDPSVNLRYAVYYIRLLNDRFGGNFPIAVASYNGGPHHMSRAHRDTFGTLSLDAFVEMIPREEPRDYVKKVVGFYQQYITLYGPDGARVILPKRLDYDDPSVVNF